VNSAVLRARLERTPPGYRCSIGRVLLINCALMIVVLLAALDQTIIATALPHVVSDIGGLGNYAWVFGAYLLAQTATIPIYGKLGDIHGRRTMMLIAISVFLIGSILCGAAKTMPELIAFRAVQGVGAGGLMPLVQTTIADIIPPRDRGRYIGLVGGAFGSAAIAGPVLGGLIVDHTSWRWIFYLNVPIGLAALVVTATTLPKLSSSRRHAIDYLGAGLIALGVGSLLVALIWAGGAYPLVSVRVLGPLGLSMVSLVLFIFHERRAAEPILPFAMLRTRAVTVACCCFLLISLCQFGAIAYLPLFAQGVIGSSAVFSGLILTPFMLGNVVASAGTGQIVARTGRYRAYTIVGPLLFAAGMLLLWHMGVDATAREVARDMFVAGIGVGMMNPVFTVQAQNAVSHEIVGSTTAFMQFSRSLGMTFGAATFGFFISHRLPAAAAGGTLGRRLEPHGRVELTNAIHPAFAAAVVLSVLLIAISALGIREAPLRDSLLDEPAESRRTAATFDAST
jgi:EmrB/QacA subfamily drug resistance transporter